MLVRRDDDGALVIGQLSHSWLSGQLARAWGNERFGVVEAREEVVLGAEQHDIGWASFDLVPRFNPETGLPRSFLELTVEDHLAIWRSAPERLISQSEHAALVVSLHGRALSELRAGNSPPDQARALLAHVGQERARQETLRARLGVSERQCERIQRQMWAWDGFSLALCNGWRPFRVANVPSAEATTTIELRDLDERWVTVDPWPFAEPRVEVRCEARRLAASYPDEATLREAFASAEPFPLVFSLSASEGL